jgi:hypothetical protein
LRARARKNSWNIILCELPRWFREAGEKSLKHVGRWDCGYLLTPYLPDRHDITNRISSKRRAIA